MWSITKSKQARSKKLDRAQADVLGVCVGFCIVHDSFSSPFPYSYYSKASSVFVEIDEPMEGDQNC